MSDSHTRPLYVKKRSKSRKRPDRLHGAFTGGFSAGHFNTVGSKNGWKPSDAEGIEVEEHTDDDGGGASGGGLGSFGSHGGGGSLSFSSSKSRRRKRKLVQRPEDFMDEEDANEWGGPVKVKEAYQRSSNDDTKTQTSEKETNTDTVLKDSSSLRRLLHLSKNGNGDAHSTNRRDSVGKQLLKVLGWREDNNNSKSYAYVPLDIDEKGNEKSLLSSIRLKRIEMHLSSRKDELIPAPKIDTYGMGYEPYKNAPEFKAHREMRRQRAEERARAASSTNGSSRMNVYNMSALDDDDDDVYGANSNAIKKIGGQEQNKSEGNILAYETTEDFIGNTTAAGFALHDDDDQVYDHTTGHSASLFNKGEKGKINLSDYHTEAYEGSDSDIEDTQFLHGTKNTMQNERKVERKAEGTTNMNIQSFAGALNAWASEGKSGTGNGKKNIQAVTSDGQAPLTGFELGGSNSSTMKRYPGPDVPVGYKTERHKFSHLDAISTMKALSSLMREEMKSKRPNMGIKERNMQPMAGNPFASLADALKNRFTGSTMKDQINAKTELTSDPRKAKVQRTTVSWQPSRLLLKRFNVNTGLHKVTNSTSQVKDKSTSETREQAFFRNDVLSQVQIPENTNKAGAFSLDNHSLSAEKSSIERPSLDLMRSIFEPPSEDEELPFEEKDFSKTNTNQEKVNIRKIYQDNSLVKDTYTQSGSFYPDIYNQTKSSSDKDKYDVSSDSSHSLKRKKKSKKSSSRRREKKRKRHKSKRI